MAEKTLLIMYKFVVLAVLLNLCFHTKAGILCDGSVIECEKIV